MNPEAERIYREALLLPEEDRADVAGLLLESLEADDDSDVDQAWRSEVARRVRCLDDGLSTSISWETLRRSLQERLT